jgi:hypothetical protein
LVGRIARSPLSVPESPLSASQRPLSAYESDVSILCWTRRLLLSFRVMSTPSNSCTDPRAMNKIDKKNLILLSFRVMSESYVLQLLHGSSRNE